MTGFGRPGEDTDIIPGLRPHTTAGEPLPVPVSHRRRRRDVPRWAWIALLGVPSAVAAGVVGWWLGGPATPHSKPPAVASAPSRASPPVDAPFPLPSSPRAPSPRLSPMHTAPRPSRSAMSASQPSPTVTPSPTPQRTRTPEPSPTPTQTSPSPSPSDTPPTPSDSPEATDG